MRVCCRYLVLLVLACVVYCSQTLEAQPQGPPKPSPSNPLDASAKLSSSYEGLVDQVDRLQDVTGIRLTTGETVPDEPTFVFVKGERVGEVLKQLRLLLSDEDWAYHWAGRAIGSKREYRLWREPVDPKKRRSYQERILRERMKTVSQLLAGGPTAADRLSSEDPELAAALRSGLHRPLMLLAASLSPSQLSGVLSGKALTVPFRALSASQQRQVRQAAGNQHMTAIAPDGTSKVLFDSDRVEDSTLIVSAQRSKEPGALSIHVHIATEQPGENWFNAGGDALYPSPGDAYKEVKAQKRGQVDRAATVSKTVSIKRSLKDEELKPVLASYLKQLGEQSGLSIVGLWPKDAKESLNRLNADLVRVPVGEALDQLADLANCSWTQDGRTVRFRYRGIVHKEAQDQADGKK
jgi:hypothetical protein